MQNFHAIVDAAIARSRAVQSDRKRSGGGGGGGCSPNASTSFDLASPQSLSPSQSPRSTTQQNSKRPSYENHNHRQSRAYSPAHWMRLLRYYAGSAGHSGESSKSDKCRPTDVQV